jgi:hypothetical protein
VKWWRSEDGGGFPSLAAPLSDRDGEYQWGVAAQVNLVPRAGRPPPIYIVQYDGGHQPCRVRRPRSGHESKTQKAVGPKWWEIKTNSRACGKQVKMLLVNEFKCIILA